MISSMGAPQGTVLRPALFTLYMSDLSHNTELCHMQKVSDDTAIVACNRDGQKNEYRTLVKDFVEWCRGNLNTSKTKEIVLDYRKSSTSPLQVSLEGVNVEVVGCTWTINWTGQQSIPFPEKAGNICSKLLLMFYQLSSPGFSSILWYAEVAVPRRGILDRKTDWCEKLALVGLTLQSVASVAEEPQQTPVNNRQ